TGIFAQGGGGATGGDAVIGVGGGGSQPGMAARFQAGTGTDVVIGNAGCLNNSSIPYGAGITFLASGGSMSNCQYSIFGDGVDLYFGNFAYFNSAVQMYNALSVNGFFTANSGATIYNGATI